jgi:8-oxo-dGTP diphosphatase
MQTGWKKKDLPGQITINDTLKHFRKLQGTMKREYPETPLVGIGAVIVDDDRVLLVKRGHAPLLGKWSIPGGVLEVGETVREAAAREAKEETGLSVEVGELLGIYDRVLRDDQGRVLYHYVLIDFLCRRVDGEPKAGGDAADARWFRHDEWIHLGLAADTQDVIVKGLAKSVP